MEDLNQSTGGQPQDPSPDQGQMGNTVPPIGDTSELDQPVVTGDSGASGDTGEGEGQSKYDLEGFNKHFGASFEDESSLKTLLESSSKFSDFESQLASRDEELKAAKERAAKFDEIVDYFDPTNLYGDEQTWKMVSLRKQFPDDDPAIVQSVIGEGFNNLSDIDKLVLADKLQVPGKISDEVRVRGVLKKLGIEADDLSELTDIDRYTISSAVADKRELFDKYRKFTPEEVKFDLVKEKEARDQARQAKQNELKDKWKPMAESLLKNYREAKAFTKNDKGDPVEVFKYAADEKFQSEFIEPLMAAIVNANMEPTQENLQHAANYLDQQFKIMNFDRIVTEAVKFGRTQAAESTHKDIHNDQEQNTGEAPPRTGEGKAYTLKEMVDQGLFKK